MRWPRCCALVERCTLPRTNHPKAAEFTLVLNDLDRTVNSAAALSLARQWEAHGATVSVYTFPASLGLPHNVLDGREAAGQSQIVLPSLASLAHGDPPLDVLRRRPVHVRLVESSP